MVMLISQSQAGGATVSRYLNETSVGANSDNKKMTDVQLVQFFLFDFYLDHPELFIKLPKTRFGGVTIIMDGAVGPQTVEGIRLFQDFQNRNGNRTIVDAKVSVASATFIPGSVTPFTIIRMNDRFFHTPPNDVKNKQFIRNLHTHPAIVTFTPELQANLAELDGPNP